MHPASKASQANCIQIEEQAPRHASAAAAGPLAWLAPPACICGAARQSFRAFLSHIMAGSPHWERRAKPKPGHTLTLLAQWVMVFLVTQFVVVSMPAKAHARRAICFAGLQPPKPPSRERPSPCLCRGSGARLSGPARRSCTRRRRSTCRRRRSAAVRRQLWRQPRLLRAARCPRAI